MQTNGNMKNERDKIDDLFRQKLEGYQVRPSVKVWNNIVNRFSLPHAGPFHLLNMQNIIGALLLVGAGVTTYLLWPALKVHETAAVNGMEMNQTYPAPPQQDPNPQAVYQASVISQENSSAQHEHPGPSNQNSQPEDPPDNPESPLLATPGQTASEDLTKSSSSEEKLTENQGFSDQPVINEFKSIEKEQFNNAAVSDDAQNLKKLSPLGSPFVSYQPGNASGLRMMDDRHRMQDERIRSRKADYRVPAQFSAGIHFLPEWTNYHTGAAAFQSSYTQELLASVQLRNIILRTGLGINRSQDDGNYQVNYSKYEMTGYYIGTSFENGGNPVYDSLNYSVDEHGVYDTVYYNEMYRTDNTYTYLQIPLHIGYSFLNDRRFSFSVTAGPCLSLLLNEKKSDPAFMDFAAQNVTMQDQTPVRRHSEWQFQVGISTRYLITNRLSIALEPTYRQYFRTVSEGSDSGWPPYSLGIRAGISFHF